MPEWLQIVIAIVIALVALMVGISLGRRRRSGQLRERFGPEYDRAVADQGDQKRAESTLTERERRRKELDIRPLTPEERDRFGEEWRVTQLRFVDDPHSAIGEADRLVAEAMRTRGYPMEDFDQRAADISVDHPTVVENYRSGHAIAELHARGEASTEDLRQAMVHYRALFDELLQGDTSAAPADGDARDDGVGQPPTDRPADRPAEHPAAHPAEHPTERPAGRGADTASPAPTAPAEPGLRGGHEPDPRDRGAEPGLRGGRATNGDPDGKRTEVT